MERIPTLTAACCLCTVLSAQSIIDRYLTGPVTYTDIVTSANTVINPRDLDFKPNTHELWVMQRTAQSGTGGSMVIVHDAGLATQTSEYRKDSHSGHFMVQASAMAFGDNGEWAAVNEVQNTATPTSTFMGPALWTGDLDIFATVFQNNWVTGDPLGSHIQMLHQSPFAMGIAADSARVYWVMDGHFGNIVRYDFMDHHGPGYDYHGAGKIWRYTDVPVTRVPNVPSHMVLDREHGWLYFIDGGNRQIKRMDVHSGAETGNLSVPATSNEPLAGYRRVEGATVEVVDTWTGRPCGIDYADGRLIVSDQTNGDIRIYDVTGTPTPLGTISTGQAGIMGLKVGPDGKIWYVQNTANKVVRIDVPALADDAALTAVVSPLLSTTTGEWFYSIADLLCGPSVAPVVTLTNRGDNALTSAHIAYTLDDQPAIGFDWTGNLAPGASAEVTLPTGSMTTGPHLLTAWVEEPNGTADGNARDNKLEGSFRSTDPIESAPYFEGFDAAQFPPPGCDVVGFNRNCGMSRHASVGGFGESAGCMKMDNYSGDMDIHGQLDHLLLPRLDLSSTPATALLEFSVAYRRYNSSSNDRLMVKVSTDCGNSWSTLYDKEGAELATATPQTSAFTPNATQWRSESVEISSVAGQSDVLFLFQTESDYGNNVYVDDISIGSGVAGIDDAAALAFSLFPNPNNGNFTLRTDGTAMGNTQVRVLAMDGRTVQQRNWSASAGGSLQLDLGAAAPGSYVVELIANDGLRHRLPIVVQ
ncbi:MAG TPA: T9SS type A sorting domain-containing protein [Flavobacteriales bacterium]